MIRDAELIAYRNERREAFATKCMKWALGGMLLLLGMMFYGVASAQGVANVGAPVAAPSFFAGLLQNVGDTLVDVLKGALVGLIAFGMNWLRVHTANMKLAGAIATGTEYLQKVMVHLSEGLAPKVKEALANDGVIDAAERKGLIESGTALVLAELPPSLGLIAKVMGDGFKSWLGGSVAGAVDKLIDANVVRSVNAASLTGSVPAPAPTRP